MASNRVYIGRLSHRVRDKDVERMFRSYGRIRELVLKNGYGFVEYDDYRDADDAVYELNGKDMGGERIIVEHARGGDRDSRDRGRDRGYDRGDRGFGGRGRGRGGGGGAPVWLEKYGPPTRTDYRVIIENLSSRCSWQDLKDYMRQAGEVTYADAHRPHRGEGVVEFATYSDMKNALEKLDDTEISGKRIVMIEDKPRGSSRRSRSRSQSRSRSRSPRSRSKSKSRSRSRSRSRSERRRSRSGSARRSASPAKRSVSPTKRSASPADKRSPSPRKSRSRSPSRSRSRSRSPRD